LPDNDDAPHRPQEEQIRYDLALGKTREVADNILERLRRLNEQYPSQDLADAIRHLTEWRDKRSEAPPHDT
jgi:hypothetical protein